MLDTTFTILIQAAGAAAAAAGTTQNMYADSKNTFHARFRSTFPRPPPLRLLQRVDSAIPALVIHVLLRIVYTFVHITLGI